jgi:hypothetical protein
MSNAAVLNDVDTAATRAEREQRPVLEAAIEEARAVLTEQYNAWSVTELAQKVHGKRNDRKADLVKRAVDVDARHLPMQKQLDALQRASYNDRRVMQSIADYSRVDEVRLRAEIDSALGYGPKGLAEVADRWAERRATARRWAEVEQIIESEEGVSPVEAVKAVVASVHEALILQARRGNSMSTSVTSNMVDAATAAGDAKFVEAVRWYTY